MVKFITLITLFIYSFSFAGPAEDKLDYELFSPDYPERNTDGMLIMVDGNTIYEKYGRDYHIDTKHISWSTAKGIAGILMGIAADQGYFRLTDPVNRYIPEFNGDATILDVLRMSSNIEYFEEYDGVPIKSNVVGMLYLFGPSMGFAPYTLSLPFRTQTRAGNHFYYSSGDTNLLMEILRRVLGEEKYKSYPWDAFFNRIGMESVTFEQDASGTFVGSSYVYATLRQFGNYISLLANNGFYKNDRVIPESYMKLLNTVSPGARNNQLPGEGNTNYSVQLHTNQKVQGTNGLLSYYSELPEDALYIYGHQGQMFYAIPSLKTVIVHIANEYGSGISTGKLLRPTWDFIKEKGYPTWDYRKAELEAKELNATEYQETIHHSSIHRDDPAKRLSSLGSIITKIGDYLEYRRVPKLIRTLAAKEFCSCLFVVKRTKYQCRQDIKTSLPIRPIFNVNWKKRTVRTNFIIGSSSEAEYVNDRFGCRLNY